MEIHSLLGRRIVVDRSQLPKVSLSSRVLVSEQFRSEMNDWLLDQFGTKSLLRDGEMVGDEAIVVMNLETFKQLKRRLDGLTRLTRRSEPK